MSSSVACRLPHRYAHRLLHWVFVTSSSSSSLSSSCMIFVLFSVSMSSSSPMPLVYYLRRLVIHSCCNHRFMSSMRPLRCRHHRLYQVSTPSSVTSTSLLVTSSSLRSPRWYLPCHYVSLLLRSSSTSFPHRSSPRRAILVSLYFRMSLYPPTSPSGTVHLP
jgi:hypothetical protein